MSLQAGGTRERLNLWPHANEGQTSLAREIIRGLEKQLLQHRALP